MKIPCCFRLAEAAEHEEPDGALSDYQDAVSPGPPLAVSPGPPLTEPDQPAPDDIIKPEPEGQDAEMFGRHELLASVVTLQIWKMIDSRSTFRVQSWRNRRRPKWRRRKLSRSRSVRTNLRMKPRPKLLPSQKWRIRCVEGVMTAEMKRAHTHA